MTHRRPWVVTTSKKPGDRIITSTGSVREPDGANPAFALRVEPLYGVSPLRASIGARA